MYFHQLTKTRAGWSLQVKSGSARGPAEPRPHSRFGEQGSGFRKYKYAMPTYCGKLSGVFTPCHPSPLKLLRNATKSRFWPSDKCSGRMLASRCLLGIPPLS